LFLTTSIAGRARKEREILYEGGVCLLEKAQGRVLGITSCFVYEMQFSTYHDPGSLAVEVSFIIELEYEYLDSAEACIKKVKKLSCQKRLYPGFHNLSVPGSPSGNDRLFIIPIIKDMAYRYEIAGDGMGVNLTIGASMEYIATDKYYTNAFECEKEQPESGIGTESISWKAVYNQIGLDDAITCLENMIRLLRIRRLFREQDEIHSLLFEGSESEMMEENRKLTELKKSLEDEIQTCRMTIAKLNSELRDREDIIGKLLLILDRE
jgi:hypothetical protein